MTALLELDEVRVSGPHGDRLNAVSLRLQNGERIALLGRSGAGKSSLIGVLNGSLPPAAGHVRFQGVALASLSRRQLSLIHI